MRLEAEPDAAVAVLMLGVEALSELSHAGPESEFADGAAAGFAAGRVGLVGVVVFVVGAVAAVVVASGGGGDLGLSPAGGDAAVTSSTGLFYKSKDKEIIVDGKSA